MTRNRLSDLNDHLFAQLERLADEALDADRLDAEVKRAEAIVAISDQVTSTADLQLKAAKLFAEHGQAVLPLLPQIGPALGSKRTKGHRAVGWRKTQHLALLW